MLKVRTRLAPSPINGLGVFADEDIEEGAVVWEYDPLFDLKFDPKEIDRLAPPAQEQVKKYAYFDTYLMSYVLCGDDARFINHSSDPNLREVDQTTQSLAARFIARGEEITSNYFMQ